MIHTHVAQASGSSGRHRRHHRGVVQTTRTTGAEGIRQGTAAGARAHACGKRWHDSLDLWRQPTREGSRGIRVGCGGRVPVRGHTSWRERGDVRDGFGGDWGGGDEVRRDILPGHTGHEVVLGIRVKLAEVVGMLTVVTKRAVPRLVETNAYALLGSRTRRRARQSGQDIAKIRRWSVLRCSHGKGHLWCWKVNECCRRNQKKKKKERNKNNGNLKREKKA